MKDVCKNNINSHDDGLADSICYVLNNRQFFNKTMLNLLLKAF